MKLRRDSLIGIIGGRRRAGGLTYVDSRSHFVRPPCYLLLLGQRLTNGKRTFAVQSTKYLCGCVKKRNKSVCLCVSIGGGRRSIGPVAPLPQFNISAWPRSVTPCRGLERLVGVDIHSGQAFLGFRGIAGVCNADRYVPPNRAESRLCAIGGPCIPAGRSA